MVLDLPERFNAKFFRRGYCEAYRNIRTIPGYFCFEVIYIKSGKMLTQELFKKSDNAFDSFLSDVIPISMKGIITKFYIGAGN